jgi:hypothetical protein
MADRAATTRLLACLQRCKVPSLIERRTFATFGVIFGQIPLSYAPVSVRRSHFV